MECVGAEQLDTEYGGDDETPFHPETDWATGINFDPTGEGEGASSSSRGNSKDEKRRGSKTRLVKEFFKRKRDGRSMTYSGPGQPDGGTTGSTADGPAGASASSSSLEGGATAGTNGAPPTNGGGKRGSGSLFRRKLRKSKTDSDLSDMDQAGDLEGVRAEGRKHLDPDQVQLTERNNTG